MRASKVDFASVPPTGKDIHVERPTHGVLRQGLCLDPMARDIQFIGRKAYAASTWLRELAEVHGEDPYDLARQKFNPFDKKLVAAQRKRIIASEYAGVRTEYWFGKLTDPHTGDVSATAPGGFAKIKHTPDSQARPLRYGQLASGIGISVCLHDLCVLPEVQASGLATTLSYVGLKEQPGSFKTHLITPVNNAPMRRLAEQFGYTEAAEIVKDNFFEHIDVPFVTYEAPRVDDVIAQMEDANPWLAGHAQEYTGWRWIAERAFQGPAVSPSS